MKRPSGPATSTPIRDSSGSEQITQLNELDRSLTLLLLDGFSFKEMAEALGMSESNVGVRIHRIKAHLAAQSTKESQHAT